VTRDTVFRIIQVLLQTSFTELTTQTVSKEKEVFYTERTQIEMLG